MTKRTPEEMRFGKSLADWIRRVRVDAELSHRQLAEVAGVLAYETVRRWEDGESMPNPFHLSRLRSFARNRGLEVPEL